MAFLFLFFFVFVSILLNLRLFSLCSLLFALRSFLFQSLPFEMGIGGITNFLHRKVSSKILLNFSLCFYLLEDKSEPLVPKSVFMKSLAHSMDLAN